MTEIYEDVPFPGKPDNRWPRWFWRWWAEWRLIRKLKRAWGGKR